MSLNCVLSYKTATHCLCARVLTSLCTVRGWNLRSLAKRFELLWHPLGHRIISHNSRASFRLSSGWLKSQSREESNICAPTYSPTYSYLYGTALRRRFGDTMP